MNNRQTGGIPTKVGMPPCVFEIVVLAIFEILRNYKSCSIRRQLYLGMSSGVIPSTVYSVGAIEDKTQISRQRFSGAVG